MRREVVLALLRVALMNAVQYRASFLFSFFVTALTSGAMVIPLFVVFDHSATVAGWTLDESLLVTAFFLFLSAVVEGVIEPNLGAIVEGVRSGQLDYLLLKPADAQIVATCQRVDPSKVWQMLTAFALGGYALSQVGLPSVAEALTAAVLLAAGCVAIYALWVMVICTSFWFVRVDNLRYLLGAVTDAGRWPVTIYTGFARVFLTVIVPVALVTSWPAMALLGRMDAGLAAQSLGVAVGMLVLSRWVWVRAIASYTSASS